MLRHYFQIFNRSENFHNKKNIVGEKQEKIINQSLRFLLWGAILLITRSQGQQPKETICQAELLPSLIFHPRLYRLYYITESCQFHPQNTQHFVLILFWGPDHAGLLLALSSRITIDMLGVPGSNPAWLSAR